MKILFIVFITFLLYSCNDKDKELEKRTVETAKIIDSVTRFPVLAFFNDYQKFKYGRSETVDINKLEKEVEALPVKNDVYFSYRAYCSYFQHKSFEAKSSALKALELNSSNYLADCFNLFYDIVDPQYDSKIAKTNHDRIVSQYPSENLGAFEECYRKLKDFADNPGKYITKGK